MKKLLLFAICLGLYSTYLNAQTLVSTDVEKKNVVLEEFTGIHCGYCPEGHAIAQQMHDDNHGDVVVIAIHQGNFATPGAGEPDFRTSFGDPIANQTSLTGYPSGTVNRHYFEDLASNSGTAMSRGSWTTAAGRILAEDSPVNVGFESIYNDATRELTVNVELYYTSNSPESSNFINVALLQSNILGPQSGGGMGNNYVHNHMLRHLITGQWGDEVTTTTQGTLVERTYTYTVPENYTDVPVVIEDCDIAVFVTESQQEIYTGTYAHLDGGTTLIVGQINNVASAFATGTTNEDVTFDFSVKSLLTGTESFTFDLGGVDKEWNAKFEINGTEYTSAVSLDLDYDVATPVTVTITPDANSSIESYTFSMTADSDPDYFPLHQEFTVLSNVSELVLNNQGSWAGGVPADFEQIYFDGINSAGLTDYASISYKKFMEMANAQPDVVGTFNSIFYNIAWTFPGLTDEVVGVLSDYLDNGGKLFVAGQDLGWDTWETDGNGTDVTRAFYTNYLHATYNADGSSSNSSINAEATDPVFGSIANSSLSDAYGGNMYPDEIEPADGDASSIFYYNDNTSKSSAVRVDNGTYKVVYLGFDPAMVSDAAVQNAILKTTAEWFSGFFASATIVSPITCNGECDGSIQINVSGGTEPYTYDWTDPSIDDVALVEGLCAGTYEVTVSDQGGVNTQVLNVTLEEPALLAITNVDITPASSGTSSNGSASITIEGGSGDYAILWNDPDAQTTATATDLLPGDYTVTVTDNVCDEEVSETVTIGIGVNEMDYASLVKVYPNPSNGNITVDLNGLKNVQVDIYTMTGTKVFESSNNNDLVNMKLQNLESGVYFLRISNDDVVFNKTFTVSK